MVHESTFTILCALRGSHDFEWLQHCDRHGYVEHTGGSFRTAFDLVSLRDRKPISTAEDIKPRHRAYPVVAKDTALRLADFKSSVRTKIIAPVFMVTMLMAPAGW